MGNDNYFNRILSYEIKGKEEDSISKTSFICVPTVPSF